MVVYLRGFGIYDNGVSGWMPCGMSRDFLKIGMYESSIQCFGPFGDSDNGDHVRRVHVLG